ncbi:MAG TPA: type II secretion system protein GspM [Desulfomonilia bacterium]
MKINLKDAINLNGVIKLKDELNDKLNQKLTRREKQYLFAGCCFAMIFILVIFVMLPLGRLNARMEKNIDIKEKQLNKVYEIGSKIKAIESANASSRASRGDFTVFGYLEDLAGKQNIKDKIEYMKPVTLADNKREAVEIRIKGVSEGDLIGFLYGIDTSPTNLKFNRFNLRKSEKDKTIDVTFQVQING